MSTTQTSRPVAVNSPLGEDVLLFRSLSGKEQIGRLFEYKLELLSTDSAIDLDKILAGNIAIRLELADGSTRYFNGYVSQFSQSGEEEGYYSYHATLRPWLWFLTRTSNCRIFQNKTVPDIIKEIFTDYGFNDFEDQLSESYTTKEYCVQYRETAFNFVSRLMEQEGIYYYFIHSNGKHNCILADAINSHKPFPGYDSIPYYPPTQSEAREEEYIAYWTLQQEVQPGQYSLQDFDFEKPKTDLEVDSVVSRSSDLADFEMYDYPGLYSESENGEQYAKVRVEALQNQYQRLTGRSNARGIASGALFKLTQCPREDLNQQYLILSTNFEIRSNEFSAGAEESSEETFIIEFIASDSSQPFRSLPITPKPMVQGPQSAIVVGQSGEELDPDKYGRVKVQFHWDRAGNNDQNSSCWIRVSSPIAGKGWGSIALPRIGQEVIVEFMEGDPDRPIIMGRVYNDDNMPPYSLPEKKSIASFKSNSTKGGAGFNEIRMDDKKGDEQLFLYAEKNLDLRVKNDRFESIGAERHLTIVSNQLEHVTGDKHNTVDGDQNIHIKGTLSSNIAMDQQQKVGSNLSLEAGSAIHLKAGATFVLEAGTQLSLKVGGSFVDISPSGVTISGPIVQINSGGSAASGPGCSPDQAELPTEADTAEAGGVAEAPDTTASTEPAAQSLSHVTVGKYSNPQAQALSNGAKSGAPFAEKS